MTARHAGLASLRPTYAYTGRHEAPPAEGCRAAARVASGDGEASGLLVCNKDEHDELADPMHYDETDDVLWCHAPARVAGYSGEHLAELAGAVA